MRAASKCSFTESSVRLLAVVTLASCWSSRPQGGTRVPYEDTSGVTATETVAVQFHVDPTWNDCDDECWRRKRSEPPEPECKALGRPWLEAEEALVASLQGWLRPTRSGRRITVRHSTVADYHRVSWVTSAEVADEGTIVIVRVSGSAGWVKVRSHEFSSTHCVDIAQYGDMVQLTPRIVDLTQC